MEMKEHCIAFQKALAENHDRIKAVETIKGSDHEFIPFLKEYLQEARRDANFALEELKKSRGNAEERFSLEKIRLKALETTAVVSPSGPPNKSSDSMDEEEDRVPRRDSPEGRRII